MSDESLILETLRSWGRINPHKFRVDTLRHEDEGGWSMETTLTKEEDSYAIVCAGGSLLGCSVSLQNDGGGKRLVLTPRKKKEKQETFEGPIPSTFHPSGDGFPSRPKE